MKAKLKNKTRKLILLGVILLAAVVAIGVWAWHRPTGSKVAVVTPSPKPVESEGPGKDTTEHAGPASDTSTQPQTTATPAPQPSALLTTPIETLSSHEVKLGSSSTLDSTCATTVGASCYIQASKGTVTLVVSDTKTVPNDASGGVELPWNANKLTAAGDWSIVAVASLHGQTAMSDPQTLTVTP